MLLDDPVAMKKPSGEYEAHVGWLSVPNLMDCECAPFACEMAGSSPPSPSPRLAALAAGESSVFRRRSQPTGGGGVSSAAAASRVRFRDDVASTSSYMRPVTRRYLIPFPTASSSLPGAATRTSLASAQTSARRLASLVVSP